MGRIQGLTELFIGDADQLIKSTEGFLFSITLTWTGATAGEYVILRDGEDGNAEPHVPFVFNEANGTITKEWPNGKRFANGIFYDAQSTGVVQAEITYK